VLCGDLAGGVCSHQECCTSCKTWSEANGLGGKLDQSCGTQIEPSKEDVLCGDLPGGVCSPQECCTTECPAEATERRTTCYMTFSQCEYNPVKCTDGSLYFTMQSECGVWSPNKWFVMETMVVECGCDSSFAPATGDKCRNAVPGESCGYDAVQCSDGSYFFATTADCQADGTWSVAQNPKPATC